MPDVVDDDDVSDVDVAFAWWNKNGDSLLSREATTGWLNLIVL